MAATVIRNFIAKALFKKKGAIANNKAVEFSSNALEQRLKNFGIDPNAIKSEQELNQILSYVKQAEDQAFQQRFGDMLAGSRFDKQADVLDMTGKKINPSKGIMGGKEINEQTLKEGLMKTDNPFSDLVNTPRPKTLAEREAEVLAGMEKNNKEAVQRIRNRKMVEEAIDNVSPGFAGDRKYDAQLVADDLAEKRFGKDFYDLDQKQQLDLYDEAYTGLSDSRFKNKPDPEDMATGGRAGFKTGLGKGFLEFISKQIKPRSKPKFDIEKFRKGPIDLDFLKSIDKKDLAPFIRSRDTMGRGGYGMYDNFKDMPAGLRAAELISTIKGPRNEINYKAAELFLGKKLKGNESADELIQMLNRQEMRADGGRIGYDNGSKLSDFIDVQASGSKSGKQQIKGAPEGITADNESINAIIKADIPISQKIDLLAEYKYGKGRTRIEDKGQEIYMDEGGFKDQDIGFGYNQGGEGISGSVMRDLRTGDDEFKIKFSKKFAEGGRIGLKDGMDRRTFLKIMGGLASVPILSKFLKPAKVASKAVKAAPVVSKSTPPPYFFELANKIKTFGKPDKVTYADRVEIHRYRGKNGDEYELIEDLNTGDMKIQKDKTGVGTYGDKSFDTIEDRTEMVFKKGQADETTKGKPADEYEEYKVEFDSDGTAADATELDAAVQKEIIEEATGNAPSIKKAGGGIARMLGE